MNARGLCITHCTVEAHAVLTAYAQAAGLRQRAVLDRLLLDRLPSVETLPQYELTPRPRQLLALIQSEPGIASSDASLRLAIGSHQLFGLVHALGARVQAVRTHEPGRKARPWRLYPAGHPGIQAEAGALADQLVRLSVEQPGLTFREISGLLGYHHREVTRRCHKLAKAGRISLRADRPNHGKRGGPPAYGIYPAGFLENLPRREKDWARAALLKAIGEIPGSTITRAAQVASVSYGYANKVVRQLLAERAIENAVPCEEGRPWALYLPEVPDDQRQPPPPRPRGRRPRVAPSVPVQISLPMAADPRPALQEPERVLSAPPLAPSIGSAAPGAQRPKRKAPKHPNAPKPSAVKLRSVKDMPAESLSDWLARGNKPTQCPGVGEPHPLPEPSRWKQIMHARIQTKKKARELARLGESHAA